MSATKQRSVLALLLTNANRFVSTGTAMAELWGEQMPPSAEQTLRVYISRLRRRFPPVRHGLVTHAGGYELRVAPGERDVDRFRVLVAAGLQARGGRPEDSVDRLGAALRLWRGTPLADVAPTPLVAAEADRLGERRLVAVEALAEAKLAAGQHGQLIAELRQMVAEHPLRERLWHLLMDALRRAGQRAEALDTYREARRVLAAELGVEPGEQLRRLHREILACDPPATSHSPPGSRSRRPVHQLTADVPCFVGRKAELSRAVELLAGDGESPRVVVVTGPAGVGKSTFAVHVAHMLRDQFPDGQLYANLRGSRHQPMDAGDVLATMLASLGVGRAEIPDGRDRRAGLLRDLLFDRRIAIVLDNATHEDQVRPLLPGLSGSAVLITSRTALAGLDGAGRVELGLLPEAEALRLLAHAVDDDRCHAERDAATQVVTLCGRLPLALRIAGARLAGRPHWSMRRLAEALRDERGRLDELSAGDLAVRASIGLTYEALGGRARRAYRLLGMLDAPSFPAWALGPLLDCDLAAAERTVEELVDCRLLEAAGVDRGGQLRYRFHDLLRLYARERATTEEPPQVRVRATERLCEAYADLAARAEERSGSGILAPVDPRMPRWRLPEDVVDRMLGDPVSWLEAERSTVNGLIGQAVDMHLPELAWRLAAAMAVLFENGGHFDDWRYTHELALGAVRRAGDRFGEAVLRRSLGELHTIQDRYAEAIGFFEGAMAAYRDTDRSGEAATAAGLGVVHRLRGHYPEAEAYFRRSLASARASNNMRALAYAANGLSTVHLERGEVREARQRFSRTLAAARGDGHVGAEATALRGLGLIELALGRPGNAAGRFEAARSVCARHGDRVGEVHALHWLGHIADVTGDVERGAAVLGSCLEAYRRYGERFGEALTLRNIAELDLHAGRADLALQGLTESLALWGRIHSPYWSARTLDTQAASYEAGGQLDDALAAAEHAATLRASVGLSPDLRAATYRGRALGGHLHRP